MDVSSKLYKNYCMSTHGKKTKVISQVVASEQETAQTFSLTKL